MQSYLDVVWGLTRYLVLKDIAWGSNLEVIGQIEVKEVDYGDYKRTEAEFPGGCIGYGMDYMTDMTGLSKDRIREINPAWVKLEEEAEKEFLESMKEEEEPEASERAVKDEG